MKVKTVIDSPVVGVLFVIIPIGLGELDSKVNREKKTYSKTGSEAANQVMPLLQRVGKLSESAVKTHLLFITKENVRIYTVNDCLPRLRSVIRYTVNITQLRNSVSRFHLPNLPLKDTARLR